MIKRIDHISLAVTDYEKARVFFTELLGLIPGACGKDDHSGFFWQLYTAGDLSRFELITPVKHGSFLDGFLRERAGGVHHITVQVENIRKAAERLDYMKIPYFGYNDRYDNWKELFIHPKNAFGLLVQFAEFEPAAWLDRSQNTENGEKWNITLSENIMNFQLAHPGGGTVNIDFDPEEVDLLISGLTAARNKMKNARCTG